MEKNNLPALLENDKVKARFVEVLNKNAANFMQTLLTVYNNNPKLQECNAKSILAAAGMAATLNLSIAPSLGHAYIVPYKGQCQFQLGWKGLIQLAHRTNRYTTLNSSAVYEGQIRDVDCITGELIRGEKISNEIVGYSAYMELDNGFKKGLYMTLDEIKRHAQEFSQSYAYDLRNGKKSSVWSTNFDAMAKKTVLKLLINRWGVIASSDLAKALQADQSVLTKTDITYVDNGGNTVSREDYSQLDSEMVETVDTETGEILTAEG